MADVNDVDVEANVPQVANEESVQQTDARAAAQQSGGRTEGSSYDAQLFKLVLRIASVCIFGACWFLGWSEARSMCDARTRMNGAVDVTELGCASGNKPTKGQGEVVHLACNMFAKHYDSITGAGDFESYLSISVFGLKTVADTMQCVETKQGGEYAYEKKWQSTYVDSSLFSDKGSDSFLRNCGAENPRWPAGAPRSSFEHAEEGQIGQFPMPFAVFKNKVKFETPYAPSLTPPNWTRSGFDFILPSNATNNLGDVRVRFYHNDWPMITAIGFNRDATGELEPLSFAGSWICPSVELEVLRVGDLSVDTVLAEAYKEPVPKEERWGIRAGAFAMIWMAFCFMFSPLKVAEYNISPLFAPCMCCTSCFGECFVIMSAVAGPTAFAIGFGVLGVVWLGVRPALATGTLIGVGICLGCDGLFMLGIWKFFHRLFPDLRAAGADASAREVQGDAQPEAQSDVQSVAPQGAPLGAPPRPAEEEQQPGANLEAEASPEMQPEAQPEAQPAEQVTMESGSHTAVDPGPWYEGQPDYPGVHRLVGI